MLKRLSKILLKVLLLLVVLFFAFLLFERIRGEISLALYKRELAAKDETLDIHKLLGPPVADADNGAPEFSRLTSLIKTGKVLTLYAPPKMSLGAPGMAVVGFREGSWITYDRIWRTNTWAEVADDLATNREVFEKIRAVLAKPAFDFKIDHSAGADMLLTNLPGTKSLCLWLGPAVQYSLREGNREDAISNLLAALALPRVLENDHIIISELVRIAIGSINFGTTWEALQADGWTDGQLAQIQDAWTKTTFITNVMPALRIERADDAAYFERFRKSNEETFKYMFPTWLFSLNDGEDSDMSWQDEFLEKQVYCRIWRFAWSHQDEKFLLEKVQRVIDAKSTGAEKAALQGEEYWFGLAKPPPLNFYDNWRFSMSAQALADFSMTAAKAARAETDRSMVLCAIALKRHSLRHGNYPASLDALVPEFLPSVPLDYMDGKPLKYHLNSNGSFALYSVGNDGKDDGGDASPVPGTIYRNLWRGKDVVWPQPAAPGEVFNPATSLGQRR